MNESFYSHNIKTIDGKDFDLSSLKGKKLLIVNVASKCGFTPQYQQLEELYQQHKDSGFEILAFPCNNFGKQEVGTHQEIQTFCQVNYGVTFTIFEKVMVKGSNKHSLYEWLTNKNKNDKKNVTVIWNFQKFLIDEEGQWVDYFLPSTSPKSKKIERWINS
jgi:glutathione peroxidase